MIPFLRLMRISALPTLCSNVLAAFFLGCVATGKMPPFVVPILLLLTCGPLYLAGMVLNDFFDAKRDAVERPERPIPSGRVSRFQAGILGTALILWGLLGIELCAEYSGSLLARPVGWVLVAWIIGYDALLKHVPILGAAIMSLCRFFNILFVLVVVNAQTATIPISKWDTELELLDWPIFFAFGVMVYVFGLTVVSSYETGKSDQRLPLRDRISIILAVYMAFLGLVFCVSLLWGWMIFGDDFRIGLNFQPFSTIRVDKPLTLDHLPRNLPITTVSLLVLSLIPFVVLARSSWKLLVETRPDTVRRWVGTGLASMILIDATCCLVYGGLPAGLFQAGLILALYPVAMLLRRIVPMT